MQTISIGKTSKYKVAQRFPEREWEVGDIVMMDEKSGRDMILKGYVETYKGTDPHKHVSITVDPIRLFNKVN